jgi:hypothetical protein
LIDQPELRKRKPQFELLETTDLADDGVRMIDAVAFNPLPAPPYGGTR